MGERIARRWAQLEADRELAERFEQLFTENGWVPEDGHSALETFAAYARAANVDDINDTGNAFAKRYTRSELINEIVGRTTLGDAKTVRRILDVIDDADLHDGVLETLAKRDTSRAPEEDAAPVSRHDELRSRVGAALGNVSFRDEAHREARQAAVESFLSSSTNATPGLVEQVSAAWNAVEKEGT